MVGFLCAANNEAKTGKLVAEQLHDSPWFPLLFCALFIWASLVPITRGAKRESFGARPALILELLRKVLV
jgi:hypothetical protein